MAGWFSFGKKSGVVETPAAPPPVTPPYDFDDPRIQRPLRVFISHRWQNPALHSTILTGLELRYRRRVQDCSLVEAERVGSDPAVQLDDLQIETVVSRKIRNSDVVFVPGDVGAAEDKWLKYETEEAAKSGRPVVFVTEKWRRRRWNRNRGRFAKLGVPSCTSTTDPDAIVEAVRALVPERLH